MRTAIPTIATAAVPTTVSTHVSGRSQTNSWYPPRAGGGGATGARSSIVLKMLVGRGGLPLAWSCPGADGGGRCGPWADQTASTAARTAADMAATTTHRKSIR